MKPVKGKPLSTTAPSVHQIMSDNGPKLQHMSYIPHKNIPQQQTHHMLSLTFSLAQSKYIFCLGKSDFDSTCPIASDFLKTSYVFEYAEEVKYWYGQVKI